jgi:hypothetical protein
MGPVDGAAQPSAPAMLTTATPAIKIFDAFMAFAPEKRPASIDGR